MDIIEVVLKRLCLLQSLFLAHLEQDLFVIGSVIDRIEPSIDLLHDVLDHAVHPLSKTLASSVTNRYLASL